MLHDKEHVNLAM